jgi:cytochrome P450
MDTTVTPVDQSFDFSIMPSTSATVVEDFHGWMATLRRERPVAPVLFHGGTAYLLTRYDYVLEGFQAEKVFNLREFHKMATFPTMGENIMGMEGEQHRRHRQLVSLPFRPSVVGGFRTGTLLGMCNELIDGFVDDGEAEFMSQFAKRLPVAAIARLLGLPEHPQLEEWAIAFITFQWDPEGSLKAATAFTEFLRDVVEDRRRHPGPDLVSQLLVAQYDGEELTSETLMSFVRMLFPTGSDTTYLAVGVMLQALAADYSIAPLLRESEGARVRFIEECLRWEGPVGAMPRVCTEDVEFHGEHIPAGGIVLLGITGANRDPEMFADPDRFDPHRDARRHLSFGIGRHFCLGAPLARAEMLAALETVVDRFERLEPVGEPPILGALMRGPNEVRLRFQTRKV